MNRCDKEESSSFPMFLKETIFFHARLWFLFAYGMFQMDNIQNIDLVLRYFHNHFTE